MQHILEYTINCVPQLPYMNLLENKSIPEQVNPCWYSVYISYLVTQSSHFQRERHAGVCSGLTYMVFVVLVAYQQISLSGPTI